MLGGGVLGGGGARRRGLHGGTSQGSGCYPQ